MKQAIGQIQYQASVNFLLNNQIQINNAINSSLLQQKRAI